MSSLRKFVITNKTKNRVSSFLSFVGKLFAVAPVRRRPLVVVVVHELQEDVDNGGGAAIGCRTHQNRAGVNFKSIFPFAKSSQKALFLM
jgi:hypothetical protein